MVTRCSGDPRQRGAVERAQVWARSLGPRLSYMQPGAGRAHLTVGHASGWLVLLRMLGSVRLQRIAPGMEPGANLPSTSERMLPRRPASGQRSCSSFLNAAVNSRIPHLGVSARRCWRQGQLRRPPSAPHGP
jgi:hypothetical protein